MSAGRKRLAVAEFRHMYDIMAASFLVRDHGDGADVAALAAVVREGGQGLRRAHGDRICEVEAQEVRALELCRDAAVQLVASLADFDAAVDYADAFYNGEGGAVGAAYVRLRARVPRAA
jgi:hypothetical protein